MAEEKKPKKSLQELCEAIYNDENVLDNNNGCYCDFASEGRNDDDADCQCD